MPGSGEPIDLARHGDGPLLDAAVALVEVDETLEARRWGIVEEGLDLVPQRRLVCLDGEQVVGAGLPDGGSNGRGAGNRVDGDEGAAFQGTACGEALDEHWDRRRLVRFLVDRLLSEHEPVGGGEGRDEM